VLTNTVEISPQPHEDSYDDNLSTWVGMLHEHGPNLQVHKHNFGWEGEDRIQYEIRVKNLGTQRLEGIWITDTYAESTAWNGDWGVNHGPWFTVTHHAASRQLVFWAEGLDPGDTASLNLRVDLDEAVVGEQGLVFANTLEAAIPGDVYPADNTDEAIAYSGIDLYAEKWISGGEPRPGERMTMTLRFGNGSSWPRGTSGGARALLTERLPTGMTYVGSVWPDGSPHDPFIHDPGTGLVSWDMGQLGSDDHRWFFLVVDLDAGLEGGDVLLNQVELQQSPAVDVDYDAGNNLFELPLTILNPKFEVAKTTEGSEAAGARLAYTLTVTNDGPEAGTNVVLSDTVPAGLTYGGSDGSFDGSDVTWNLGSIAATGGTAQGWFWGTLTCSVGELVNNAQYRVVSSDQGVSTPAGGPVSLTTVAPTLSPAFEQSAASIGPGETVDFSDVSMTDGGSLAAWSWNFGDGQTGSGTITSHLYGALGTYTVTLTVTDTCGFSNSVSVPNAVSVEQLSIYLPLVTRGHTS